MDGLSYGGVKHGSCCLCPCHCLCPVCTCSFPFTSSSLNRDLLGKRTRQGKANQRFKARQGKAKQDNDTRQRRQTGQRSHHHPCNLIRDQRPHYHSCVRLSPFPHQPVIFSLLLPLLPSRLSSVSFPFLPVCSLDKTPPFNPSLHLLYVCMSIGFKPMMRNKTSVGQCSNWRGGGTRQKTKDKR